MNSKEMAALMHLAAALAPPVLEFINNVVRAMDADGLTGTQRMQTIQEMQASLRPMQPILE